MGDFTFGIVLTGGGSRLDNIDDLAQEIFQQPIKIGNPELQGGISDKVKNPRFSTGVGLIYYGIENLENINHNSREFNSLLNNSFNKIINKFKNWY